MQARSFVWTSASFGAVLRRALLHSRPRVLGCLVTASSLAEIATVGGSGSGSLLVRSIGVAAHRPRDVGVRLP